MMLHAPWQPLLVELFVAFASSTFIREIIVPLHCKHAPCVIEAEEVNYWHQRSREYQANWMDRERFFAVAPCPLQQGVLKLFWIPAELTLLKQVIRASMVTIVLENELFPRQRELVCPCVGKELLPFIWRKGRPMHH